MLSFIFYVVFKNFLVSFLIWIPIILFDFLSIDRIGIVSIPIVLSLTIGIMTQFRVLSFLRRTSKDIKSFWINVGTILTFNILLNFLIWISVYRYYYKAQDSFLLGNVTILDFIWLFICSLVVSFLFLVDPQKSQNKKTALDRSIFIQLLFYFFYIALSFVLLFYSKLLAYSFIVLVGSLYFVVVNQFSVSSLVGKYRIRVLGFLTIMVITGMASTFEIARRDLKSYSGLLLRKDKFVKYDQSELEALKTAHDWFKWRKIVHLENNDQIKFALLKLESLCPINPSDFPAEIICFDREASELGVFMSLSLTESEIFQWLSSDSAYLKLSGALAARNLPIISSELRSVLMNLEQVSARLSVVIGKTLMSQSKKEKAKLVIRLLKE